VQAFWLVAAVALAADQLTKQLVMTKLAGAIGNVVDRFRSSLALDEVPCG